MSEIGKKICQLRKQKGLTQEMLAEAAKINLRTLQRIESSNTEPRMNTLKCLCDVLQVNIEEVIETGLVNNMRFLAFLHLSVMAGFLVPYGNIIVPLILWLIKKDKISFVREQGINILNFQIIWYSVTVVIAGIIFFNQFIPYIYYLFLAFFAVNAIYPIIISIVIRKGHIRNYYPSFIRILK